MMGGASKTSAATSAAPLAGARRIGAGTIGEAAAIARRASTDDGQSPLFDSPPESLIETDKDKWKTAPSGASLDSEQPSDTSVPPEAAPDPALMRRTKAGAGQLKDDPQSGSSARTAVHLILADRAYAYGQHIVGKDKGTKLGDVLAIES